MEIDSTSKLEAGIQAALDYPGPVLVRVIVDYRDRKIRWIDAVARQIRPRNDPSPDGALPRPNRQPGDAVHAGE